MKLLGVRIRIHPTFVWLLVFFFLLGGTGAVAWMVVVFTFVVLHELSHSLVAKAHGIPVLDITLLPIGGVARLGSMPEDSATEFKIAIAGPALNFVIAGVVYITLALSATVIGKSLAALLEMILLVNLALGIFNLLPAFPMDGGRLLRAYLATKRGYLEATYIAARIGRWIAAGMVVLSLVTLFRPDMRWNPWLILIAAFIYVSGKREEMAVAARHAARGLWGLFGFSEPAPPYEPGGLEVPPHDDRPEPDRGDVIDVEGEVRRDPDASAADAFRRLSQEIDSHLKR